MYVCVAQRNMMQELDAQRVTGKKDVFPFLLSVHVCSDVPVLGRGDKTETLCITSNLT